MSARFLANNYLQPEQEGICSYLTNIVTTPHNHDYYEFFLIENGVATHHTHAGSMPVSPGTLCFMRPGDTHFFSAEQCSMFNLLIREELWEKLIAFIGPNPVVKELLSSDLPVHISIQQEDFETARQMLEANILVPHESAAEYNSHLKVATLSLLERFFVYPLRKAEELPSWLDSLLEEMQNPGNYSRGVQAMYCISGYTPEHLCRTFKRYLNTTPTAYLNTLRVQAAGRYLVYTDEPIIDIALKCGFNSLSHFYHLFKDIYKLSPMQHRKLHKLQHNAVNGKGVSST